MHLPTIGSRLKEIISEPENAALFLEKVGLSRNRYYEWVRSNDDDLPQAVRVLAGMANLGIDINWLLTGRSLSPPPPVPGEVREAMVLLPRLLARLAGLWEEGVAAGEGSDKLRAWLALANRLLADTPESQLERDRAGADTETSSPSAGAQAG